MALNSQSYINNFFIINFELIFFQTGLDPANDIPHLDDNQLVPGKKYVYTVKTVYQGQESATLSCAACTMPRKPINFEGSYTSDTAIRIQWDEDEGAGFVSSK